MSAELDLLTWSLHDQPFTGAAARAAGVSQQQLERMVRIGALRRPLRRVYVGAQVPDSRELRGQVLALVAPPGSVVCDWTACWYWTGMDRPGRHREVGIDVFRMRGQDRLRSGLARSGQRTFEPQDVVQFAGDLMVTTPLRTAWDLGRFFSPVIALGGMDALLRLREFERGELLEGVRRFNRQRGVVQLRVLALAADPRSESHGESALRWRWLQAGDLPRPVPQVVVTDDQGRERYRIDLAGEGSKFGAEYDGVEYHGAKQASHDTHRRLVLRDELDWMVRVFRSPQVFGVKPSASVDLLRAWEEYRRRG
ncbi:MAG: hypothetical protein QM655_09280 [Nocardioidaceae bacterium]